MVRPKITQLETIKRIPSEHMTVLAKNAFLTRGVFVVAFRGYYQDTMGVPGQNDRGIYDDCFAVIAPDYFQTFNANTDPSRFKTGVATLVPGLHMYKKGKHGITTHPKTAYNAFRPASPDESVPVWRDGFGSQIFKGIAINIHRGGYNTTSSEGCQTVHPDQYNAFQVPVYDLMTKYKQDQLPYVLIPWVQ